MSTRALLILAALSACGDNSFTGGQAGIDASVDAPIAVDAPVAPIDSAPDASTTPDGGPFQLACTIEELQPVFTCALASCTQDLTFTCLLSNCGLTLLTLPADCRTCLITAVASQDIATTAAACGLSIPGMTP